MINSSAFLQSRSSSFLKSNSKTKTGLFGLLILSILLFLYVYSVSFPGLPSSILSRRFVAIVFFVYGSFKCSLTPSKLNNTAASKEYGRFIKLHIVLLVAGVATIAIIGFGDGRNIVSSYLETIIFGSLAFYGISKSYDSLDDFVKSVLIVTIAQAFIILIGTLSGTFRSLMIKFTDSSIWDLEHMTDYGYAIGFGCITSSGVFKLSLGLAALVYLITKDKKHLPLYLMLYIFLSVIMVAVARTGLILIAVSLLALIIIAFKRRPLTALKTLIIIFAVVSIGFFIVSSTKLGDYFQIIFQRLINTITENTWSQFFVSYISDETTIIPKIGFFGELTLSGISGLGHRINVDGGYIKVLFAMGIPLAVLFYFSIILLSLNTKKRKYSFESHIILYLLFVFMLLGEFKEYFIEDVYFFVFLMLYKHFLDKETKQNVLPLTKK